MKGNISLVTMFASTSYVVTNVQNIKNCDGVYLKKYWNSIYPYI